MPLDKSIQKVLVIGSGPIVIGQAAEFDYAGAQACRVLKDAGINVVLCNSNPATIMTDQAMADEIYLEPLTVETVKRIIKKERPDSILAGLGGQTGLTLAMQLDKEGFLQAQGVRLLGTDAAAISRAEDRELFKEAMAEIGQPVIASDIAETIEEALAVADRIGYPVIVRPAFTLGGTGGGFADDETQLREMMRRERAVGGPAERTFENLIGLQLRPKRMREAAQLWERITAEQGIEARDAMWSHPDLLPALEPEGNADGMDADSEADATEAKHGDDIDWDAELSKLLDESENGTGEGESTEDADDGDSGDQHGSGDSGDSASEDPDSGTLEQ